MKNILISTDRNLLDLDFIHNYLNSAYWARGRTKETIRISLKNSLCFGIYLKEKQIGFARAVTDYAVFAYLMDIFITPEYQGFGYGSLLMDHINSCSELKKVGTWKLATKDAHKFYRRKGFTELTNSARFMEKKRDP